MTAQKLSPSKPILPCSWSNQETEFLQPSSKGNTSVRFSCSRNSPKEQALAINSEGRVEATHLVDLSELSPNPKEQALTVFTGSTSEQWDRNYTFKRSQGSRNIPESSQPKSEDFTQGNFPSDAWDCFKSDHIMWRSGYACVMVLSIILCFLLKNNVLLQSDSRTITSNIWEALYILKAMNRKAQGIHTEAIK